MGKVSASAACAIMLWCMPDLRGGIGDQEVELLVPEGSLVAAPPAGGIILAAAHDLRPQAQAAVGVALPGEPPHPQAARLYQIHLCQQCRALQSSLPEQLTCAVTPASTSLPIPQRTPHCLSYCKGMAQCGVGEGGEGKCAYMLLLLLWF